MKNFIFLISIALFISCSEKNQLPPLVEWDKSDRAILIENVDIFNGRENKLIKNKDMLIEKGLISSIQDEVMRRPNFTIIDGSGKTVMPGFIDAHVHLSGSGSVPWENRKADIPYNLQAYLYAGITTVYDLGGLSSDLSKVAEKVKNNEILGPSVYHTHIPITVKNSHPIPLTEIMLFWPLSDLVNAISPTIDEPGEASKIIKKYVGNKIDYVKIICDQIPPGSPEMTYQQLKALIDEAHRAKKKVFVHIGSPENAVNAVKAGADVLAHGVWRGRLSEEQAEIIVSSKVPIIYTLSGFKNVAQIYHGEFEPNEIDKKLVAEEILNPVTNQKGLDVKNQKVMNKFFEDVANQSTHWEYNFQLLHDKGAIILVGTDSNLPGTYAGSTYFQELDELKNYGMTNFEILSGATYLNALLFLENPNFGTVEENKKADLLIVNGNPLEDLQVVQNPELIMREGNIINKLRPIN